MQSPPGYRPLAFDLAIRDDEILGNGLGCAALEPTKTVRGRGVAISVFPVRMIAPADSTRQQSLSL